MGKADSLSRRPDWEIEVERDNENKILVKLEWLEVRRTEEVEIIVDGVDLLEEVRKSKVKDDEVVKAMEEMKQAGVKMLRDEEWREVYGIMYKKRKVYVPKDNKLRTEIIRLHHNMPVVMNIKWDYGYCQPWSDNEWLVDKMMVLLNKDIIMQ